MSLRINTNVDAQAAHRNLSTTSDAVSKSMERLSSGLRINSAADDAAGLGISEKMRAQIRGLAQSQRNIQDGVSMVQTAEGNLDEVHSILQRVRELAVQYKNGSLSTAGKGAIQSEVDAAVVRDHPHPGCRAVQRHQPAGHRVGDHVPGRRQRRPDHLDHRSASVAVSQLRDAEHAAAVRPSTLTSTTVSAARAGFGAVQNRLEHTLADTGHLPGEPDRRREPHPRRGHGRGDGRPDQEPDPAAGRHRDAGPGQPGAAGRPAAPAVGRTSSRGVSLGGRISGRAVRGGRPPALERAVRGGRPLAFKDRGASRR